MTSRTCPDWPRLMELAPELQFKHYTLAEAQLPGEAIMILPNVPFGAVAICADLDHHVYNTLHTEAQVGKALEETHWFELGEWAARGPGAAA
jgi:hypothetical protein